MDLPSSRIPGSVVESIAAESMMPPWLCVICYVYLFLLIQGGQVGAYLQYDDFCFGSFQCHFSTRPILNIH